MIENPDRRQLLLASLVALPALTLSPTSRAVAESMNIPLVGTTDPARGFNFFLGKWYVEHRRLAQRLAGSDDWEEFDGSSTCQSILGGLANFNESIVNKPTGAYRGMGLRAFDAKTNSWADWYLDARNPTQLGVPGVGRFVDGVGTFFSDETLEGTAIKVRGTFSHITPTAFRWEQAFSADEGKTWETNWIMRFSRRT